MRKHSYKNFAPSILSCIFLFFSLFSSILPFGLSFGYNGKRWLLLVSCVAIILLFLASFEKEKSREIKVSKNGFLLIFVFFLSSFFSLIFSKNNFYPYSAIYLVSDFIYIFFVFSYSRYLLYLGDFGRDFFVKLILLLASLYVVMSFFGLLFWYKEQFGSFPDYLPWGFENIRFWSQCATWIIPLLSLGLGSLLENRRTYLKVLVYSVFAFWWLMVLGSGARGTFLAIFISGSIVYLVFRSRAVKYIYTCGVSFLLGVVLWVLFCHIIPDILNMNALPLTVFRGGADNRIELWAIALKMSLVNFPLGEGPLSYSKEALPIGFSGPHNEILLLAAEYGWLGVVSVIAFGLIIFLKVISVARHQLREKSDGDGYLLCVFWSVLAGCIHSMFSGVFRTPSSMMIGLLVISQLFSYLHKYYRDCSCFHFSMPKNGRKIILIAIFLPFSVYFFYVFKYWENATLDMPSFVLAHHQQPAPRFWLNGFFPR